MGGEAIGAQVDIERLVLFAPALLQILRACPCSEPVLSG
jgi:hypothetical protein